jgi:hypothetical protein
MFLRSARGDTLIVIIRRVLAGGGRIHDRSHQVNLQACFAARVYVSKDTSENKQEAQEEGLYNCEIKLEQLILM